MIQEFKTNKGEFIGVLVPEDSYDFEIYDRELYSKLPCNNGWRKYTHPDLPISDYKIIGLDSELTEEQAKEIVPCELIGGIGGVGMQWLYPDYTASMNDGFETALESFKSLMKKLEMYSENPLTDPEETMRQGDGYVYYSASNEDFEKYERIQSRTGKWLIIQKIK